MISYSPKTINFFYYLDLESWRKSVILYSENKNLGKSITPAVVAIRSDGRAFKPRVASSYISYFKRGLKFLKLNNETFFAITDVSELKKIKAKLLRSSDFKGISKSSQDHISSTFGKYIRYTENLKTVEKDAKSLVKLFTENYYRNGFDKDKKGLLSFLRKLSFIEQPSIKPPKFNKSIINYFDINDEKQFKLFCKVVSEFHEDQFYKIVLTQSKLTSKLLAIVAHIKFLKSKV